MSVKPRASETFSEAIAEAHHYTRWIVSQFEPYLGARTLEIGVGHGSYISHLSNGRTYAGLDIDCDAVRQAQARYPQHQFHCADLGSPDFSVVVDDRFDSVVCCNVLEHISDDRLAIENMSHVLVPDGHLLLFVPALPALYSDLDRFAGHHRRYTRGTLRALTDAAGLSIVRLRYFNPVGAVGWWLNRAARHRSLNDDAVNAQIRAFDRWGVPISRALDPLFDRFFGQSLVCIAQKPARR